MDIQENLLRFLFEPKYVKVMEKEIWIYWRLCLKLRRQGCSLDEMIDELDTWVEGASGFLQSKIEMLTAETYERHKVQVSGSTPLKKKASSRKLKKLIHK